MRNEIHDLTRIAAGAETLRLFLDYDGTLADFAPSPDTILPDKAVIGLLERLVAAGGMLPAIISGRRLAHIQKLLPVEGLLLGGTYGIEMQLPDGHLRTVLPFEEVRPTLERLLPCWQRVIAEREGFYLEDKGWSLALHGRYATPAEGKAVMSAARAEAQILNFGERFRLLGGDRFLELAPRAASKSAAVRWVLEELTPKGAVSIYVGDDDKDEEAFETVLATGGHAVRVAAAPTETLAQFRLEGPAQVRAWLDEVLSARGEKAL